MPFYCYKCECGATDEVQRPMSQSDRPHDCPKCSARMSRDLPAEQTGVSSTPGNWPMECRALGGHPSQRAEIRKHYEEAGIKVDVSERGNPIVPSRKVYRQMQKHDGMINHMDYM